MKYLIIILTVLIFSTSTLSAEAVTIRNNCQYPVAGSISMADSNVNLAQFRIIPGEKVHLLETFDKNKLLLRMTPDTYDLAKIAIYETEIDDPNCFIELRSGKNGIKVKIK